MKLEYLKSFIGVVNCKSFSQAAQKLFLSQPTISTHIKQLEGELGVQLLVRSTKDVILSESGLSFYPFAVRLLETEKEAMALLHEYDIQVGGCVTISTSSVPGNHVLPFFLADLRKTNENITFRISEGDSQDVISEIVHFETELGIGSIVTSNEKCICEPLFEDEIVLITPNTKKYEKMQGNFPIELLKQEKFVLREAGSGTKIAAENMERSLQLSVERMNIVAQFESTEMVRRSVEAGVGIGFISKLAVKEAVQQKKVLQFTFYEVPSKRIIYLIYHKDRVLSIAARTTIKCLRKYCKENFI